MKKKAITKGIGYLATGHDMECLVFMGNKPGTVGLSDVMSEAGAEGINEYVSAGFFYGSAATRKEDLAGDDSTPWPLLFKIKITTEVEPIPQEKAKRLWKTWHKRIEEGKAWKED